MGVSRNGWFMMENLIKLDDLGEPNFRKPPKWFTHCDERMASLHQQCHVPKLDEPILTCFFFHQNEHIHPGASPLVILQLFAMGLLAHLNRSSSCSSTVMVISSVCEKTHREKRGDGMGKWSVAWDGWHAATRFICCVKTWPFGGFHNGGTPHWMVFVRENPINSNIYIYISTCMMTGGTPMALWLRKPPFLCCLKQLNPHLRCVSIHAVLDLHAA